MSTATTFDSTKRPLTEILGELASGKIQLPDFQRGWVWDDEHVRSLLASISVSFPIGAVMLLETGGDGVRFKPRRVEGTDPGLSSVSPEKLILDGQQRLTSLFQALNPRKPVETRDLRDQPIKRWYYIDIKKAVTPGTDREDAILALPQDRVVKNFRGEVLLDASTAAKEYELGLFPVCRVTECSEWRGGHNEFWDYDREKAKLFDAFEREVIKRFEQYQLPVILLLKQTPKEAVCQVFEKVNTGGVSLTVFELLTATYAADDFNLRDDWTAREKALHRKPVLRGVRNDDLLQVITLLATQQRRREAIAAGTPADGAPGISCKRKDILKLTLSDYKFWADAATTACERAAKLLYGQKLFSSSDLPYRSQIVPLAAILADLDDEASTDGARKKIARWFWCGVFGELYGGATESRFARDLPEVTAWVRGGPEPTTIADANFAPARLLTLRTRNSAAYKGLYALLLRDGGQDFRSGESIEATAYFDGKIDIHHIFPRAWCKKNGIPATQYDSIVNKTPLSARTNRIVGGRAPSSYLAALEREAGISSARMDEILKSHVIQPAAIRGDKFMAHFQARAEALLQRIEAAMGKQIARDTELFDALSSATDASDVDVDADADETDDEESPAGD